VSQNHSSATPGTRSCPRLLADQKGAKIEFNLTPGSIASCFNFKELRGNFAFPWFLEIPKLHPLGNICSLITSDEKLLRDMHLRKAAIEMIDAAERWLEKHHQFKADMRNAERTFLGVRS
jgi:hypothetical protein